jgi:peptide/nickel transport system substrate-binding protein
LGWGAYAVDEWVDGESIRLVKNSHYFRMNEGLPATDVINFLFIGTTQEDLLAASSTAGCDIVSPTAIDLRGTQKTSQNISNSSYTLGTFRPDEIEMLAFGIKPYAYDDNYYPYGADRPDFFGDSRVRQAIAHCIDRSAIGNKLLGGVVETTDTLLGMGHPLVGGLQLSGLIYDPAQGLALLGEVGWVDQDFDPATPLTAAAVYGIPLGTPFEIGLLISESPLRGEIAGEIAAGLGNCGIKVNITQVPAGELYLPGPDGLIFGRQFDLALLSWQTGDDFNCRLFTSKEIPTDANYWMGELTGGANFFGFSNQVYDEACELGMQVGLDTSASDQSLGTALQVLNAELPFIPVYLHPRSYLWGSDVCGIIHETVQPRTFLMDIENLCSGDTCVSGG